MIIDHQDEKDAEALLQVLDEAEQRALFIAMAVVHTFQYKGWAEVKNERAAGIRRLLSRMLGQLEGTADTEATIGQILTVLVEGPLGTLPAPQYLDDPDWDKRGDRPEDA